MGLLKTAAKVAVASSVHGRVQRRQQQRWAAQDSAQAVGTPATQASPATPHEGGTPAVEDPLVTRLRQLVSLRDAGVLTDAEFSAKSARLLGT